MGIDQFKVVRVAAVQAEPEWNDLQKGVDKTIRLVKEAGKNGANVMGFPEVWIPGYPWYDRHRSLDSLARSRCMHVLTLAM